MTRTARTKHWRRARVQIQFLQAEPLRGKKRLSFFWPVSGCQVGLRTEKGERYSIRANPILLRSQDRPCLPLGIPFLEIARIRLAALSNEPRISAGCFQLAVLSPLASRCAGRGPGKASTGLLDFNLVVGPFEASAVCRRRRRSTLRRAR